MRPRSLDEFVGQEHVLAPGKALRRAIESGRLGSIILWGPPGCGKTTLARIIAGAAGAQFVSLSAVSAGVADLRKTIDDAARRRQLNQRTIVLIDEIHRFNKAQQDSVLHAVEQGTITLIGATTENPSFEVNSALLSRCRVFTLRPHRAEHVELLIRRALADSERGLGSMPSELAPEALGALVALADGDVRAALNGLELAVTATSADAAGRRLVSLAIVEDAMQRRALLYDRAGDQHFDIVSAFIKSLRGSDPDAAVYWMARMLEAGEDPLFIVRRMVILAAEDVGLADPQALVVAVAAQQAVHFIGMPEGYLPMAEAAIYLATAPKSNSALTAYSRARAAIEAGGNRPVPLHIRNAPTGFMKSRGYGRGYEYPHDFAPDDPRRYQQRYLPDGIDGGFYEPRAIGYEAKILERMRRITEIRREAGSERPGGAPRQSAT
ncbi:MAG: replication-associated recombination protein A [Chloroflexota bacterium]